MSTLTVTIDYDESKVEPDEIKDVIEAAIFTFSLDEEHVLSALTGLKFDDDEVTRDPDSVDGDAVLAEDEQASQTPDAPPAEDDPSLADPEDEESTSGDAGTPADVTVAADGSIQADVTTSVDVPAAT